MRPRATRGLVAATVVLALAIQALAISLATGAPSGPPPTPVPGGSRSPFPQSLATPADATRVPQPSAPVALLVDMEGRQVLFAKAPRARRPIASLTKVMTALLVLERRDPGDVVRVAPGAVYERGRFGWSSSLGLRAGERRTVRELLDALLLQSANDAADALAIDVSGSTERFVTTMNRRAARLGMGSTSFASPSGLDDRGRSTAADLVTLVAAAYETPGFARIVATRFRTIPAPGKAKPRRVQNRNAMLWLYPGTIGVKTGTTAGAGVCLIVTAERDGRRLTAIVLGSGGEAFSDAASMLDHGFEAFERRIVVEAGRDLGVVPIQGGAVQGVTGAALTSLLPLGDAAAVGQRLVVARDATYPPRLGQQIGTLRVRGPDGPLGEVPVVAGEIPLPPPPGAGPWWSRAAGAVGRGFTDALGGLLGAAP